MDRNKNRMKYILNRNRHLHKHMVALPDSVTNLNNNIKISDNTIDLQATTTNIKGTADFRKNIKMHYETTTPSAPASGDGGILYTKADGKVYWVSNGVVETDLTASTTFNYGLRVTGDVTVSGDMYITGNLLLKDDLSVGGATQLKSTLSVTSTTHLKNNLYIAGNVNTTGDIIASGDIRVSGDIYVTGSISVDYDKDTTHYFGKAAIGQLVVSDYAGFAHVDHTSITNYALLQQSDGTTNINAPSGKNIKLRINNVDALNIDISLNTLVKSDLSVAGSAYIKGVGFLVEGVTLLKSTLSVTSTTHLKNNLYIAGNVNTTGDIIASGDIRVSGDMYITGNLLLKDNLSVGGATQLKSTLSVTSTTHLKNNLYIAGNVNTTGDIIASGDIRVSGDMYITGNLLLKDNLSVGGTVTTNSLVVTTADINGGTIGGITIDGSWTAVSQTCTDLGTVTTAKFTELGINVTSISGYLDVNGSSAGTKPSLLLRNGCGATTEPSEANYPQIKLGYNGTDNYAHFIHTRHNASSSTNNAIDFYTSCGSLNSTTTSTQHNLTLNGGNVGIGTTSPSERFHLSGNLKVDAGDVCVSGDIKVTGSISVDYDKDTTHYFGKAVIGQLVASDYAGFSHVDRTSGTDYALLQHPDGRTYINAPTGQYIDLRINNEAVVQITNTDVYVTGNIGIGTTSPSTYLVVGEDGGGHATNTKGIHMKSTSTENKHYVVGQDTTHNVFLKWNYDATPGDAYASLSTYGGSNDLYLNKDGGNVFVGGETYLEDDVYVTGNLYVNGSNFQMKNSSGNQLFKISESSNVVTMDIGVTTGNLTGASTTIRLASTTGDNGNMDNCVIECREYAVDEKQELLLFCGNDHDNGSGPDRIRLRGAEIIFDTYPWVTSARTDENIRMKINGDGEVLIYNDVKITGNLTITGTYSPFTGSHIISNRDDNILSTGYIVITNGNYQNEITINDTRPEIIYSNKESDKRAFGVISQTSGNLLVNSLGEGAIYISNINGNIENGDYITTSNIPGVGMKQADDILHNYTVAKITCDCDFSSNTREISVSSDKYEIYNGVNKEYEYLFDFSSTYPSLVDNTYLMAFVGCTYHCG
jgi:cytoskeletal protein CcmA (bactofilin family)